MKGARIEKNIKISVGQLMTENKRIQEYRFTNQDLKKLIIPLVIEQFLQITIGLVSSIMVASIGEAAVSGVSLVESIFVLVINIFVALATGGAVVAGQYIGRNEHQTACLAAWQLILFIGGLSLIMMAACYMGQNIILFRIFGDIEQDVFYNSRIFLLIASASIPFIALYSAGAAIFRVMGNTRIGMNVSLLMNGINLAGAAVMIYGFHCGTEGAAIPALVSRIIAALIILVLLFDQKRLLHIPRPVSFRIDASLLYKTLRIAIPNSVESSMFQLGRILVLSLVSGFGTAAIAANAVGNYVAMFALIPGIAIGLAAVTVISQCVGAGDYDQVRYYTKKMLKINYLLMLAFNLLVLAAIPLILRVYGLSGEAEAYVVQILVYHSICAALLWPLSFSLPNTLRAASDVNFTMVAGIFSMWVFRIAFSYLLGLHLHMGVFGVWVAMTIDWLFRAICFSIRYKGDKWIRKERRYH